MATEKALRYEGGGSLSFRDGTGARRHVLHGASFLVDAETAKILLEDPAVLEGDAGDVPRETTPAQRSVDQGRAPEAEQTPPQIDVASSSKKDLLAYAGLLGMRMARDTPVATVRTRIEAELKRRQAANAPLADPTSTAIATGQPVPFAEVKTRAIALGLKAVGVNRVDLEAAIAAEEQRLADEAAAGQASSSGEGEQGGAITLGDLPASAVRKA